VWFDGEGAKKGVGRGRRVERCDEMKRLEIERV
jgi:hypothetical protein